MTEDPLAENAGAYGAGQRYNYDQENRMIRVKRILPLSEETVLGLAYDVLVFNGVASVTSWQESHKGEA